MCVHGSVHVVEEVTNAVTGPGLRGVVARVGEAERLHLRGAVGAGGWAGGWAEGWAGGWAGGFEGWWGEMVKGEVKGERQGVSFFLPRGYMSFEDFRCSGGRTAPEKEWLHRV